MGYNCVFEYFCVFFFWLFLVLVAVGFSLVVASGGSSLAAECGLLIAVVSLVEHGLEGEQAAVIAAQWWWHTDLAAPQHVGSSWIRD